MKGTIENKERNLSFKSKKINLKKVEKQAKRNNLNSIDSNYYNSFDIGWNSSKLSNRRKWNI